MKFAIPNTHQVKQKVLCFLCTFYFFIYTRILTDRLEWLIEQPTGWLTDRPTDWLTYLLADWYAGLTGWRTDSLTDGRTDWLTYLLADWLICGTDCPTDWPTGWLAGWLTDWMTDWLTGWLTVWVIHWPTDWLARRVLTDGSFDQSKDYMWLIDQFAIGLFLRAPVCKNKTYRGNW